MESKDGSDPSQNAAYVNKMPINSIFVPFRRKMKIMMIKEICDKIKHE